MAFAPVAPGAFACAEWVAEMADRPPGGLTDGDVLGRSYRRRLGVALSPDDRSPWAGRFS